MSRSALSPVSMSFGCLSQLTYTRHIRGKGEFLVSASEFDEAIN